MSKTKQIIKTRILPSVFVFLFVFMLLLNVSKKIYITEILTPLSKSSYDAMFYYSYSANNLYNNSINELTAAGTGKITDCIEIIDNADAVQHILDTVPDCSNLLNDGEYIEWTTVKKTLNQVRVIGIVRHDYEQIEATIPEIDKTIKYDSLNKDIPTYDCIEDMKKADLDEGQIVQTLGFTKLMDNGDATYVISHSPNGVVDNIFSHKLNNGYYANLQYNSGTIINVACAGITPDNCDVNTLNLLFKHSVSKIKGVQFNDGKYYVNKPVILQSLEYYGGNSTTLAASGDFITQGDKIFLTKPSDNCSSFDISLNDIDFLYETSTNHSLVDKEIVLVALQEINSCSINNCTFTAVPNRNNGCYMKCDLLWFKHSNLLTNINVNDCVFKNLTGEAYNNSQDDYLVGGCLWICGNANNYDSVISNVHISNCLLETTVSDEAFCVWQGSVNNLTVDNCVFTNQSHNNHNLISFDKGVFHNVYVKNSKILLNKPSIHVAKYHSLTNSSDVSYSNCEFIINSPNNTELNSVSIFYTTIDKSASQNSILTIDNCTILSKNGGYRTIIEAKDVTEKTIEITNCNFDVPTFDSIVTLSNSKDINISISESLLLTGQNCNLVNLSNSNKNTIVIFNNELNTKPTITINNSGSLSCDIFDNIFTGEKLGILINLNQVTSVSQKSVINYNNNIALSNQTKLYSYYSNTNLPIEDFGTINVQ